MLTKKQTTADRTVAPPEVAEVMMACRLEQVPIHTQLLHHTLSHKTGIKANACYSHFSHVY